MLESTGKNLCIEILGTKSQPHSYEAILAVWLVVNYKFVCCGPHESLLQVPKARFCDRAGACIDMYEMELSIKLVRLHSTHADFCFTDILKLKFIWPSNLSSRPIVNENNEVFWTKFFFLINFIKSYNCTVTFLNNTLQNFLFCFEFFNIYVL